MTTKDREVMIDYLNSEVDPDIAVMRKHLDELSGYVTILKDPNADTSSDEYKRALKKVWTYRDKLCDDARWLSASIIGINKERLQDATIYWLGE